MDRGECGRELGGMSTAPRPHSRRTCVTAPTDISAPIFDFPGSQPLSAFDGHTRGTLPAGMLSLTGPSAAAEADRLPVRGDLAHIKLAGRYFVPHYAVPMPCRIVAAGTGLRRAAGPDGDEICPLPAGASFDVLDIAGDWAWGQYGEDGPVGYVALAALQRP
jgi:hypothetical protein